MLQNVWDVINPPARSTAKKIGSSVPVRQAHNASLHRLTLLLVCFLDAGVLRRHGSNVVRGLLF
jgi:hypothetical protein